MNCLHNLLCSLLFAAFVSPLFAGNSSGGQIAIYSGTERYSAFGGGIGSSDEGSATGKRRQPVFIVVDGDTGQVVRVRLISKTKTYVVESPAQYVQVYARTPAGRRQKEYVRLMLVSVTQPQAGETVQISSQYDGRTMDSLIATVGLERAYPRVLRWQYEFQDTEYVTGVPEVVTPAQIDSGTATLSLHRILTRTANEGNKTLADAVDLVRGLLAARKYNEEAK